MGTEASQSPREVTYQLPQGHRPDHVIFMNPQVVGILANAEADEVVIFGKAPVGSKQIIVLRRMCGDWYFEIEGARHVAAVGASKQEACINALLLAGGSAA